MPARTRSRSLRERRREGGYTAILRSDRPVDDRDDPQIAARGRDFNWRWVSLVFSVVLIGLLVLFFQSSAFYVRTVEVRGLRYLTREEVFAFAEIAGYHLFWVDGEQVRANVLRSTTIADAQVRLGWPPNMVTITVQEREPVIAWEADGVVTWVDAAGRVMAEREPRDDLPRIVADAAQEAGVFASTQIEPALIFGALQLTELLPDVRVLRYDTFKGLGYRDAQGWDVWFGIGTNMPEKVAIYQSIRDTLSAQGVLPGQIDVVDPDHPFYTVN